jgi:LPS sulfotransferase NodH
LAKAISNLRQNLVKAARNPAKAASVITHKVLAPVGHRDYRKFVVLTRDRTGSNRLIQALNSHPKIASDYEVFGKIYDSSEREILDRTFGRQPFYIAAKGFKIFYYHPQDRTDSPIWAMLRDTENLHVIQLRRENLLHALVSSRIAYQTGVYGIRTDGDAKFYNVDAAKVRFTPEELEADFVRNKEWEDWGKSYFSNNPFLDVTYENTVIDFARETARISNFLGLVAHSPKTDFRKQHNRSLRDTVENFDQLKTYFEGSKWGSFFDD